MTIDIYSDVSDLLGLYKQQLDQISDAVQKDICQCILESIENEEDVCVVDIGIGNLIIGIDEDGLEYKFIPSDKLEDMIRSSLETGESPLQKQVENKITKRMLRIYKELF